MQQQESSSIVRLHWGTCGISAVSCQGWQSWFAGNRGSSYGESSFCRGANGPRTSKLELLKEGGALAGLVDSVSKDENPALQEQARRALENLAEGGEELRLQFLDENQALVGLVNSVFEDGLYF